MTMTMTMTMARRLKAMGSPKYQNDGDPRTSGPGFGVTMHRNLFSSRS
jgi:protein gp37